MSCEVLPTITGKLSLMTQLSSFEILSLLLQGLFYHCDWGGGGTAASLPQGPNISKCFRWVTTRERDADAVIMPCPSTSPSNPETIKTTCPYIQLDELGTENDIEVIFEQVYFWTG